MHTGSPSANGLRLKLSGRKKTKLYEKPRKCSESRNTKKLILEIIKTNNSGKADKLGVSLARENSLSVADEVLRVLREGKKRVFDMGKVSHSFQDYLWTGAGDIEQNNQKTVSSARKCHIFLSSIFPSQYKLPKTYQSLSFIGQVINHWTEVMNTGKSRDTLDNWPRQEGPRAVRAFQV